MKYEDYKTKIIKEKNEKRKKYDNINGIKKYKNNKTEYKNIKTKTNVINNDNVKYNYLQQTSSSLNKMIKVKSQSSEKNNTLSKSTINVNNLCNNHNIIVDYQENKQFNKIIINNNISNRSFNKRTSNDSFNRNNIINQKYNVCYNDYPNPEPLPIRVNTKNRDNNIYNKLDDKEEKNILKKVCIRIEKKIIIFYIY